MTTIGLDLPETTSGKMDLPFLGAIPMDVSRPFIESGTGTLTAGLMEKIVVPIAALNEVDLFAAAET